MVGCGLQFGEIALKRVHDDDDDDGDDYVDEDEEEKEEDDDDDDDDSVFGSRLTEPDARTWQEKKAKTRTALPASDSPRSKSVSPPDATGADKKTPQPPPCSPATPSEAGTRATPQQRSSSLSPSEDGQRVRIDPR